VQFDNYTTCDSALEDCGIDSVDYMLDIHLTRQEKEPVEEEVVEHKTIFLDVLKGWKQSESTCVNLTLRTIFL
jgi:hypothetical protein